MNTFKVYLRDKRVFTVRADEFEPCNNGTAWKFFNKGGEIVSLFERFEVVCVERVIATNSGRTI